MDTAAGQEQWRQAIARENKAQVAHIVAGHGGMAKTMSSLNLREPRAWDAAQSFGEALNGGDWATRTTSSGKVVNFYRGLNKSGDRVEDGVSSLSVAPSTLPRKPRRKIDVRGRGESNGIMSWESEFDPIPEVPRRKAAEKPPAAAVSQLSGTMSRLAMPEKMESKVKELLSHPRTRRIGERLQQSYILRRADLTGAPERKCVPTNSRKNSAFAKLHDPIGYPITRGGTLDPVPAAAKFRDFVGDRPPAVEVELTPRHRVRLEKATALRRSVTAGMF